MKECQLLFDKTSCVNKELIERLKIHMTKNYRLGKCEILENEPDTDGDSIEDVECLEIEKRAKLNFCLICKKELQATDRNDEDTRSSESTISKNQRRTL